MRDVVGIANTLSPTVCVFAICAGGCSHKATAMCLFVVARWQHTCVDATVQCCSPMSAFLSVHVILLLCVRGAQRPEDMPGRYRFLHRMAVVTNRERLLAKKEWDKVMKLRAGADALAEERARKAAEVAKAKGAAPGAAPPVGVVSKVWTIGESLGVSVQTPIPQMMLITMSMRMLLMTTMMMTSPDLCYLHIPASCNAMSAIITMLACRHCLQ
jgi:hypothetical protein